MSLVQVEILPAQGNFDIQPIRWNTLQNIRNVESGCSCYMADINHCSDEYFLFGDAELIYYDDFSIETVYMIIDGEFTPFYYESIQYTLRMVGPVEPVFDLFYDFYPKEDDIRSDIQSYGFRDNALVTKDPAEENQWLVGDEMALSQGPIEEFHLFESNKYFIRFFKFKRNFGIESMYFKGEAILYEKGSNDILASMLVIYSCGC